MSAEASTSKDKGKGAKIEDESEEAPVLTNKNKGKDAEIEDKIEEAPVSTTKDKGEELITVGEETFLTPELKEVYKKLDRRMKELYHECKTDEGKIILLKTTRYDSKKGKYEINSIFIAISTLSTIAITVTATYINDENSTKIFIITLNYVLSEAINIDSCYFSFPSNSFACKNQLNMLEICSDE
ncbi:hypothetical protein Glove_54g12 [Diversispora epigaea]|uniref:Uncharacterized protein n=1 Tax=Diversispora epigaea TaxID=1348612 RepID=A0A397JH69_9GLOM|nr:hypothetical protein Glove_54g12 [Diversispora epigaea]